MVAVLMRMINGCRAHEDDSVQLTVTWLTTYTCKELSNRSDE
jgi:hypothetical protein